ncbi:MAG: hypothetical protein Kow0029_31620 [Candidatus Rifleibacteriota bacterium]
MLNRIRYRCWQFKQVLFPKIDMEVWNEALNFLPQEWRKHLIKLRPSERAHVLRVYSAIKKADGISEEERSFLQKLALVHDIGKGVTRHSVFYKVAKVIFPISNAAHCIAGARLLKRLGADRTLVKMVLRHHSINNTNRLLMIFQSYDDNL